MKQLLILLFFFSTQGFSKIFENKGLFCTTIGNEPLLDISRIDVRYTPFIFGYECTVTKNNNFKCKKNSSQLKYSVFYLKINKNDKLILTSYNTSYVTNNEYIFLGSNSKPKNLDNKIVINLKTLEQGLLKYRDSIKSPFKKFADCKIVNSINSMKQLIAYWVNDGEEIIRNRFSSNP